MIRGKCTGLRAVEESDLKQLLEWRNQTEFRKYFREYRELGMASQKEWFEHKVLGDEHTRMFSVVELETGELIGACGLCYIDWVNRCADFSIYIGKDGLYIDSMYAADAAGSMTGYAFGELGLHRLWSEVYETDERKKAFFETLGFVREAVHRQTHWTGGKWTDSWYYRLLESEAGYGNGQGK